MLKRLCLEPCLFRQTLLKMPAFLVIATHKFRTPTSGLMWWTKESDRHSVFFVEYGTINRLITVLLCSTLSLRKRGHDDCVAAAELLYRVWRKYVNNNHITFVQAEVCCSLSLGSPRVEAACSTSTPTLRETRRETCAWGCNWVILSLGGINTGTWS
jgi:hypothetical protein